MSINYTSGTPLSVRQYAAIHLRVPDSGDPELDAMIRKARQAEDMRSLLAAYIAAGQPEDCKVLSIWALNDAASLDAAREATATPPQDAPPNTTR